MLLPGAATHHGRHRQRHACARRGLDGAELAQFLDVRATGGQSARDDIVVVVLEAIRPGADGLSVHYYAGAAR
jgi:hypothetical protein